MSDLGVAASCIFSAFGVDADEIDDDSDRARAYTGAIVVLDRFDRIALELKQIRLLLTPKS